MDNRKAFTIRLEPELYQRVVSESLENERSISRQVSFDLSKIYRNKGVYPLRIRRLTTLTPRES